MSFFLAAPHVLAACGCPAPAGGARARSPGQGCRAHTRPPIHLRTPFPAAVGAPADAARLANPAGPGRRGSRTRTHTRGEGPFPAAHGGWTTHARGHARRLGAGRPPGTRGGLCARAALVPAPSRPRPGGGACWGRVLRHRPGSSASRAAPATSSSSSSSGSEPAEQSQGRAEGPEGAGGAGHGAMAHQTGIHGEGGWRAGRGQRVSTRRRAPSPAPAPVSSGTSAGKLPVLFRSRASPGVAHLGEGDSLCRVGSGCAWRDPAGAEVSVLCVPTGRGCACVCPSMGLCASLGVGAPGCAHLGEGARVFTCLVCAAPSAPTGVHIH